MECEVNEVAGWGCLGRANVEANRYSCPMVVVSDSDLRWWTTPRDSVRVQPREPGASYDNY